MKRYIQFLSVVAAAGMLVASCAKVGPSKAEVEAGFDSPAALPTLTISGTPECDAINGIVNVSVTVSGLPSDLTDLSLGILSSQDPTFSSSKFVAVESPADGSVTMQGAVTANSTYYVKAVAASPKGGASYSEVVTVEVPDIPLYAKAPGVYTGTVVSAQYGDEYTSTLYIYADEDDPENVVWIGGIEPYYADNGYTGEELDLNYVQATVDEESGCLVVALGADANLGGRTLVGFDAPTPDDASAYAPITFKMTASGDLYRYEGFYTVKSNGSAEDCYAGDVTYKRK